MTKRPPDVKAPAHWTNPPVPAPDARDHARETAESLSPTRYGDWEHKGIAVDF